MKKTILILLNSIFILNACISEDDTPVKVEPIQGKTITLEEKADPTEAHQFWIELATGEVTKTHRENWDLGFYCGDEFRVTLNSSLQMAVGKIENAYSIDAVNSQTIGNMKSEVQVGNYLSNEQYVDNPSGDILNQTTAIAEINNNDNLNNVYLLNLGNKVFTGNVTPGSINTKGDARGWKKIRILRHQQGYKIQYADLDATTHKEFIVTKDNAYNFRFFSFTTESYTDIQPKKKNWDISFSVFTNVISAGSYLTSYVYPDFFVSNSLGKVSVYEVVTAAGQGESTYNNFKLEDVDHGKLLTYDQRAIGGNWRTTTGANGAEVYSTKFYVLKNSDGFYYKIRFLRMKDDNGNRGYPQFEYKAL